MKQRCLLKHGASMLLNMEPKNDPSCTIFFYSAKSEKLPTFKMGLVLSCMIPVLKFSTTISYYEINGFV